MIALASASPRRRSLLETAGFTVSVVPANIDEVHRGEEPVTWARRLAADKARATPTDLTVVAADTVVHRDGALFDKPRDREHAADLLRALSGHTHTVTTAWVVRRGAIVHDGHVHTRVRFRVLNEATIARYLATGEADDKAGAYAVQGVGAALIAGVEGSLSNVVGLPLDEVVAALAALGEAPR